MAEDILPCTFYRMKGKMRCYSVVAERYVGGYLSNSINGFDAPNYLNSTYRLAESSTAYGNHVDAFLGDERLFVGDIIHW
jgi:hypothetical protein